MEFYLPRIIANLLSINRNIRFEWSRRSWLAFSWTTCCMDDDRQSSSTWLGVKQPSTPHMICHELKCGAEEIPSTYLHVEGMSPPWIRTGRDCVWQESSWGYLEYFHRNPVDKKPGGDVISGPRKERTTQDEFCDTTRINIPMVLKPSSAHYRPSSGYWSSVCCTTQGTAVMEGPDKEPGGGHQVRQASDEDDDGTITKKTEEDVSMPSRSSIKWSIFIFPTDYPCNFAPLQSPPSHDTLCFIKKRHYRGLCYCSCKSNLFDLIASYLFLWTLLTGSNLSIPGESHESLIPVTNPWMDTLQLFCSNPRCWWWTYCQQRRRTLSHFFFLAHGSNYRKFLDSVNCCTTI